MIRLQTATLNDQNISAYLLVGTYTGVNTTRGVIATIHCDQIQGGGDYLAYFTKQIAGAGAQYMVGPITTAAIPAAQLSCAFTSIPVPLEVTDVLRAYVKGVALDNATVDIITRFYDSGVWDDPLTGTTHNVATSAGRRLRAVGSALVYDGTVASATANTITFAADASANNNIYRGNTVVMMSGAGAGQARAIVGYVGATRTATIDRPWDINPLGTQEVNILADVQEMVMSFGVVVAATGSTLQLAATEPNTNDVYRYCNVVNTSATGATKEARLITAYDGATQTVTVTPDWTVNPAAGDVYKIMPLGRVVTESMSAGAITAAALATDAVGKINGPLYYGLADPPVAGVMVLPGPLASDLVGSVIAVVAGTGIGQVRLITAYTQGNGKLYPYPPWTIVPTDTSTVAIGGGGWVLGTYGKILGYGAEVFGGTGVQADVSAAGAATVWASPTRTLTQSAAAVAAAVQGASLLVRRGDRFSAALTNIGALTGYTKLWLMVKTDRDQVDTAAILSILLSNPGVGTDGLQRLNGAATTAAWGSLTVDDEPTGDVTIALNENATVLLRCVDGLYYDIQYLTAAGGPITRTEGRLNVAADVTRAIA